jgi:hypothetical protein
MPSSGKGKQKEMPTSGKDEQATPSSEKDKQATPSSGKGKRKAMTLATPPRCDPTTPPPPTRFTPKLFAQVNKLDGGSVYDELKLIIQVASEKKRNFSNVSATSNDAVAHSAKRYRNNEISRDEHVENVQPEIRKIVKASLAAIEAEFISTNAHIKLLNKLYYDGVLDANGTEVQKEIERLEKMLIDMQRNLVVLNEDNNAVIGSWTDAKVRLQQQELSDWAYMDLLISRFKVPSGATVDLFKGRDPGEQERFRTRSLKAYNAVGTFSLPYKSQGTDLVWCCITKEFLLPNNVVAAHIVPYNIGELQAEYIFGEPSDKTGPHLMSPANCLIMHRDREAQFDDGMFSIIPIEGTNDLKVVAFDHGIPEIKRIHGTVLEFRNDFRPAKRYLYFAFVTALLRRQRHQVDGWWKSITDNRDVKMFATPQEYLRKSTLVTLAKRLGNLATTEAAEFARARQPPRGHSHAHPAPESWRDSLAVDYVSVATSSKHESDHDYDDDPFVTRMPKTVLASGFTSLDIEDDDGDEDKDDKGKGTDDDRGDNDEDEDEDEWE